MTQPPLFLRSGPVCRSVLFSFLGPGKCEVVLGEDTAETLIYWWSVDIADGRYSLVSWVDAPSLTAR